MRRNDGWIGGVVLIVIGVGLLLGQLSDEAGRWFMLGLGATLLVIWAVTRNPGALIGGGIVTGIGLGIVIASYTSGDLAGAAFLFCMGGGFIFVWLMGQVFQLPEARIWPLIPGGILVVLGAIVLAGSEAIEVSAYVWPVVLIGMGIIVLIAALRRRPSPDAPEPTGSPTPTGPPTPPGPPA